MSRACRRCVQHMETAELLKLCVMIEAALAPAVTGQVERNQLVAHLQGLRLDVDEELQARGMQGEV